MPAHRAGRGRSREARARADLESSPRTGGLVSLVSPSAVLSLEQGFPLLLHPGRAPGCSHALILAECILAPVLIAAYVLQRLRLGKEPTLMGPNWQNWAVKRRAICCLPRGAWSALAPARACVRARVHGARMDVCAPTCECSLLWTGSCSWCARVCVRQTLGEVGMREAGVREISLLKRETPGLLRPPLCLRPLLAPRPLGPACSQGCGFAAQRQAA